jgi:hypothetical protein
MKESTETKRLGALLDAVRGGDGAEQAVSWEEWAGTLDRWVEAYPAFGAGRMLRAKTARETRALSAADRLTEAAVFSSEPGRLFDLLFRAGIEGEIASFARAVEALEPEVEEAVRLRWHPVGEGETTTAAAGTEAASVQEPAEGGDERVTPLSDFDEAGGEQAQELEENAAEVVIPEPGTLAREVVLGAIERSIEKEISDLSVDESEPSHPSTEEASPEGETGAGGFAFGLAGEITEEDPADAVDVSSLSPLARWAFERGRETGFVEGVAAQRSSENLRTAAEQIEAVMDASAEGAASDVESAPGGLEQQAALIDLFIRNEPTIGPIRPEVEHKGVKELAKESLVEDASLITETMARIYAGQGQIGRARRAYKLLALKYPEKSVYFAAQSKKLGRKAADD